MDKLFDKNINEFRKQVSMKGFKPGQIPKQLFVSRFGDEVYRETVDRVINNDLKEEFEKIVDAWKTEEKLEVAAPAEHEELIAERGQDLVYKLKVALNKPLAVQGYKDLGIKVSDVVVSEEEINDVIQGVRKRFELEQPGDDDKFYSMLGVKDEAEFRSRVTDDAIREKKEKARQAAIKEALDKVIEKNPFPVLEEQIKYTVERSLQRHEDEYVKVTEEQVNEMRPDVVRAIQEERILRSIIEQESLKPTQGQVDARVQIIADSMRMDFAAVKDAMRKNGQINRIRESLKMELAQDLMIGETMPEKESV
jgi:FKBP-type peptidyl-prolyl cis-trans isomerase (trigger factor)